MATTYATVEVVVIVDSNGDIGVGRDEADAVEDYEADIQAVSDAGGTRRVVIRVKVPLPTPIELTGEVVADESGTALTVG